MSNLNKKGIPLINFTLSETDSGEYMLLPNNSEYSKNHFKNQEIDVGEQSYGAIRRYHDEMDHEKNTTVHDYMIDLFNAIENCSSQETISSNEYVDSLINKTNIRTKRNEDVIVVDEDDVDDIISEDNISIIESKHNISIVLPKKSVMPGLYNTSLLSPKPKFTIKLQNSKATENTTIITPSKPKYIKANKNQVVSSSSKVKRKNETIVKKLNPIVVEKNVISIIDENDQIISKSKSVNEQNTNLNLKNVTIAMKNTNEISKIKSTTSLPNVNIAKKNIENSVKNVNTSTDSNITKKILGDKVKSVSAKSNIVKEISEDKVKSKSVDCNITKKKLEEKVISTSTDSNIAKKIPEDKVNASTEVNIKTKLLGDKINKNTSTIANNNITKKIVEDKVKDTKANADSDSSKQVVHQRNNGVDSKDDAHQDFNSKESLIKKESDENSVKQEMTQINVKHESEEDSEKEEEMIKMNDKNIESSNHLPRRSLRFNLRLKRKRKYGESDDEDLATVALYESNTKRKKKSEPNFESQELDSNYDNMSERVNDKPDAVLESLQLKKRKRGRPPNNKDEEINSEIMKKMRLSSRRLTGLGIKENLTPECFFCAKSFTSKVHLNRHLFICPKNPKPPKRITFPCKCGQVFNRKDNLSVHEKRCSLQKEKKSCLFKNCSEKFHHKVFLIRHLESVHEIQIEPVQKLSFANESEFLEWKEKEETRTFSYFPKAGGKKCGKINYTTYYYCQHDGSDRSHRKKGEQARKTNRKVRAGLVKTNFVCIAKLHEHVFKDGHREVSYYPTHNHPLSENDVLRQPMPLSVNNLINNQISLNVPALDIYHSVQETLSKANSNVSKKSVAISRKLIKQRIAKRRNNLRLHAEDIVSVCLKVELLQKEEYNPIVIFKPTGIDTLVGEDADIHENLNDLDVDLFILGVQTKCQRKLMLEGSRKILIVGSNSITQYENMKLVNLMICDDTNRARPVAHFVTNSMTSTTMGLFMKAIKNRMERYQETLKINCVITDDDPELINGIEYAMQTKVRHILCQWHLDNVFKESVRLKCGGNKFTSIYTDLKIIIASKTIKEFENLVLDFILKHENDSKSFFEFWSTHYLGRNETWAMCYRENLGHGNVNTIAHAESFHNRVKQIYSNQKPIKRIDDLLNILLSIEQDVSSPKQEENILGFTTQREIIMNKHHRDGVALPDETIKEVNDSVWNIISKKEIRFYIENMKTCCNWDLCSDKCSSCQNLCSHLYVCSCPDSHTICKHIHRLHSLIHGLAPNQMIKSPDEPEEIKFFYVPEGNAYENLDDYNDDEDDNDDKIPSQTDVHEKLLLELSELQQMVNDRSIPDNLLSTVSSEISDIVTKCSILSESCKNLDNHPMFQMQS